MAPAGMQWDFSCACHSRNDTGPGASGIDDGGSADRVAFNADGNVICAVMQPENFAGVTNARAVLDGRLQLPREQSVNVYDSIRCAPRGALELRPL